MFCLKVECVFSERQSSWFYLFGFFSLYFLLFFNHETNYFVRYRHKGSMFDEQYTESLDNIKLCTLFYNEHTGSGMWNI